MGESATFTLATIMQMEIFTKIEASCARLNDTVDESFRITFSAGVSSGFRRQYILHAEPDDDEHRLALSTDIQTNVRARCSTLLVWRRSLRFVWLVHGLP